MEDVYQLNLENGKCIFVNPEDKRGAALIYSRGQPRPGGQLLGQDDCPIGQ